MFNDLGLKQVPEELRIAKKVVIDDKVVHNKSGGNGGVKPPYGGR